MPTCNFFWVCILFLVAYKSSSFSPDQLGSVSWASSHKAKGHWFNSPSVHMPGLWARTLVGGMWEATDQCFSLTSMFLSLSFSLPAPLSKNKWNEILKKKKRILRWGDHAGLSEWARWNYNGPSKREDDRVRVRTPCEVRSRAKQGLREKLLVSWLWGWRKGPWTASRSWQGQGTKSLLEVPEGTSLAVH